MIIALLPVAGIIFLILIIICVIVSLFGNDKMIYRSSFVLPFDTTKYTITSPYGERTDPIDNTKAFHSGIDVVPTSSNIVSVADGKVVVSEVQESGGESVIIEHQVSGSVYRSGYHHLKENSRTVKVGDTVKQGQQIGIMGNTGKSTGPHLHFSLQRFNAKEQKFEYTDPSNIITNNVASKNYSLFDYDNNKFNNNNLLPPYNNGPLKDNYNKPYPTKP